MPQIFLALSVLYIKAFLRPHLLLPVTRVCGYDHR